MAIRESSLQLKLNQAFLKSIGIPLLPKTYVLPGSGWEDIEVDRRGQYAVIIGATGSEKSTGKAGIGEGIARVLHERGVIVMGTSRQGNKYQDNFPYKMSETPFDITKKETYAPFIAEVGEWCNNRLDMLFLGPTANFYGPLSAFSGDEFEYVMDHNVIGWYRTIMAMQPFMGEVEDSLIYVTGSVGALFPPPFGGPYGMTKAAIHAMVHNWNIDEIIYKSLDSSDKISKTKMTTLMPSYIDTNIVSDVHPPVGFPSGMEKPSPLWDAFIKQWEKQLGDGDPASLLAQDVAWIISRKVPEWWYIYFNKTMDKPCDLDLRNLIGMVLNVPPRIVMEQFIGSANMPTMLANPTKYYQFACAPEEKVPNPPFPIRKIGLVCAACSKPSVSALVCGKCRQVIYCDKKCQKQHHSIHKMVCTKL